MAVRVEPRKDCEESKQRKTWYMRKMNGIAYFMCKNQANLKRSSICHKDFKLKTKIYGSEHHQTARNFPDYEKKVSLTRFKGLPKKFQSDDKNVSLTRSSDMVQSFPPDEKNVCLTRFSGLSQSFQSDDKNVSLTRFSSLP